MKHLHSLLVALTLLLGISVLSSCSDDDVLPKNLAGTVWKGTEKAYYRDNIIYFYFDQEGLVTIKREDVKREKPYPTVGPLTVTIKDNTMLLARASGAKELWYIREQGAKHMTLEYQPGSETQVVVKLERIR